MRVSPEPRPAVFCVLLAALKVWQSHCGNSAAFLAAPDCACLFMFLGSTERSIPSYPGLPCLAAGYRARQDAPQPGHCHQPVEPDARPRHEPARREATGAEQPAVEPGQNGPEGAAAGQRLHVSVKAGCKVNPNGALGGYSSGGAICCSCGAPAHDFRVAGRGCSPCTVVGHCGRLLTGE